MKLGEIKIEALKLMFANTETDLYIENMEQYERDEAYREYLVNMPGAINRCFANIEERRILPCKSFKIEGDAAGETRLRVDMSTKVGDFFDIARVVYENDAGVYDPNVSFYCEGDTLVLFTIGRGERYIVMYYPSIPRITASSGDGDEISIPDSIAAHIPYFIKGDLFRVDEPNEAGEARNWFELAMDAIGRKNAGHSTSVDSIYSQTEGGT